MFVVNLSSTSTSTFVEPINFSEFEINEALEQYGSFGQERFASKMSEIINEDAFQSARVNLTNIAF